MSGQNRTQKFFVYLPPPKNMFKSPIDNSDLDLAPLKALFNYWQKIRGERDMPAKADFSPAAVPKLLPYIALFEVEENPRRYRTRLVGSKITEIFGLNITGAYTDERPEFDEFMKRQSWLVENKTPYLYIDSLEWINKEYLHYKGLGLPFSDDMENVNFIMYGVFNYSPDTR
ncbi:PAS domain-containing protein [Emcibacter nanhaiensis]|nr:PAS domain-containing protein [Emcibacter nanhaiensis]